MTIADGSELLIASVHTAARAATAAELAGLDGEAIRRRTLTVPWVCDVGYATYRELVDGRRFLLAGDWNVARRWDAVYGGTAGTEFFERAEADGWVECYCRFHADEGRTWYRGSEQPYQLDHAFCDHLTAGDLVGARIEAHPADVLGLSDHAPLVLEFDDPPTA